MQAALSHSSRSLLHSRGIKQWTEEWKITDISKLVNNKCFFVRKTGSKIIGVCCITENTLLNEYGLYLSHVAVLPEWQRQGIGADIVSRAVSIAQQRNKNLILDVWKGNTKLKEFYEKLGFQYLCDTDEKDYQISVFKYTFK